MTWLLFLAAIGSGIANPFQSGSNAQLNKQLSSPLWASLMVYGSGLVALLLIQALVRSPLPGGQRWSAVPWWAWIGGLVSIVSTVTALLFAQKLGSGLFTGASVTAALVTSVLVDHFGLVGFKQHPAGPGRLAGCVLMVGGLWLISRF